MGVIALWTVVGSLAFAVPVGAQDRELRSGDKVGTVAMLSGSMTGELDDRSVDMALGDDVLLDQFLRTPVGSTASVAFIPQGSYSLASNTAVAMTESLYLERSRRYVSKLQVLWGFLRLAVGRLDDENDVEVDTPTSNLGMRGTVVAVRVARADGETTVWTIEGEADDVTVTSKAGGTVLLPAGYVTVVAPGAAPTPPVPFDDETGVTASIALPLPPDVRGPFDDPPLPPVREGPPDRGRNEPPIFDLDDRP